MNGGSEIDGAAVGSGRTESDSFGGAGGGLVETMTEAGQNAQHAYLTRCGEFNVERDLAFDLECLRFVRVLGAGLKMISTGVSIRLCCATAWTFVEAGGSNPAERTPPARSSRATRLGSALPKPASATGRARASAPRLTGLSRLASKVPTTSLTRVLAAVSSDAATGCGNGSACATFDTSNSATTKGDGGSSSGASARIGAGCVPRRRNGGLGQDVNGCLRYVGAERQMGDIAGWRRRPLDRAPRDHAGRSDGHSHMQPKARSPRRSERRTKGAGTTRRTKLV